MKYCYWLFLIFSYLQSCDMQNSIDLKMPPYESKLVVECYLIAGQKYKLALSESVPYLTGTADTPYINNALVIISHNGTRDTLKQENNGIYSSSAIVPPDYESVFQLYIKDQEGREISAETQMAVPVAIDSFKFLFNDQNKASSIIYFDDPIGKDYYVALLYHDSNEWGYFSDEEVNGTTKPYTSKYHFEEGDKVILALAHVNKELYDFMKSGEAARSSNLQPITEPTPIKSNINNGIGIFTAFNPSMEEVTVFK